MSARRCAATMALYDRGSITTHMVTNALEYLKDWAALEVYNATTPDYRERWRAEFDAASKALAEL
jgi:hypothetical protein